MNWKLTDNKDWHSLEQQFRWVQDMSSVAQHRLHHQEGDVAVHTRMVLEALQQQPAYQSLSALEQETLWAAALLHDTLQRHPHPVLHPRSHSCPGAISWFAHLDNGTQGSGKKIV